MKMSYCNLTNGLCWTSLFGDFRYLRIQSSHCEAKRWGLVLDSASDDLCFNLVLGNYCIILDASKKGDTRACWQGIPWIKYALTRLILGKERDVSTKEINTTQYFKEVYEEIKHTEEGKRLLNRFKYFRKFIKPNLEEFNLTWKCINTKKDGDYKYFYDLLYAEGEKQYIQ